MAAWPARGCAPSLRCEPTSVDDPQSGESREKEALMPKPGMHSGVRHRRRPEPGDVRARRAALRGGQGVHRERGRPDHRGVLPPRARAGPSTGATARASSNCSTASRPRPRPTGCGTSSCPTPRPARACRTSTTPTSPASWARTRSPRSASTAAPPTPATWRCSSASARRSRRSGGWSRCSPARSARPSP